MGPKLTPREDKLVSAANLFSFGSAGAKSVAKAAPSTILVVDSVAGSCCSLKALLSGLEHELVEVNSTSEAIAAISGRLVDLVIIDAQAPEMGGVEFCRMLRKAAATQFTPIFIVSSDSDLDREIAAIESGADEFLVKPLHPRAIKARIQASLRHKAMIESLDDSEAVLFSLAQSVEGRDPELGQHCERIALMCAAMGVSLGLTPPEILALQRGGYLHDIGKVVIPDSILFKPGRLTEEEWRIMESHAERGERICGSMRSMAAVLPIIRHHHERWDGSGYPDKLKGEQIPLLARILQIADIYDALTTARAYKAAMAPDDAVQTLREEAARGWRDPRLVELFSDILPMFRMPSAMDLSRFSLRALAKSLDALRNKPAASQSEGLRPIAGMKLVSGL
jgi:putative two-component system response regulator